MYTTIKFHPEAISIRNQIICIIAIVCLSAHISHAQNLPGFRVDGRYLYDYNNEKVILRGANAMIVYWDKQGLVNYPSFPKPVQTVAGYSGILIILLPLPLTWIKQLKTAWQMI